MLADVSAARFMNSLDSGPEVIELETPHGTARTYLRPVDEPRGALVLGHGAGGGVQAPDLTAATEAAVSARLTVALVEQPYRLAGRRSPPRIPLLEEAWTAVVEQLRAEDLAGLPLIVGGRSLGGRVACRTAAETGAVAVLCLAFPLQPPRRGDHVPPSRLEELDGVAVPTLVVQGERDPFGIPPAGRHREVVLVPGNHSLKADLEAVQRAVAEWLASISDTLTTGTRA